MKSHMSRGKGWLLASALFLTGAAVGALGLEAWHATRGGPFDRMARQGPAAFITDRMSHELGLTPAQQAQIRPIIEEMVAKMDQSREPCMAEGEAISERYQAKVRNLLTPEQAAKHDAIMKRLREQRRLMPPPPGPLPGPPPDGPFGGPEGFPPPGEPRGGPHGP